MTAYRGSGVRARARTLGVSVSALYYRKKLPGKDHALKIRIEEALRYHPAYGHRRLSLHLAVNRKRIQRVMKLFDLRPYRRRGRKPMKTYAVSRVYPNLVQGAAALWGTVWAADFTYLPYRNRFVYVATVIDIATREILGWSAMTNHGASLVLQALFMALSAHPHPAVFHSDNGREYGSRVFVRALTETGIAISRTAPASPWENGYQESFYAQFKIDLGDPNRFASLGELVYAVAQTVWTYNHLRIHLALKMPPAVFAGRHQKVS